MLAREVVAPVVPSGDVVFVEAAWDDLLRCTYKHVAIRCACGDSVATISLFCSCEILCFCFTLYMTMNVVLLPNKVT